MKNDIMIQFVKRWRDIVRRQRDVDYDRAMFARDVRDAFPTDSAFVKWCVDELPDFTEGKARNLLKLAGAARVVPDVEVWRAHGNAERELSDQHPVVKLVQEVPNRRERIEILEQAKAGSWKVTTLLRKRREALNPPAARTSTPTASDDARVMADHLRQMGVELPANVRSAVARHATVPKVRPATRLTRLPQASA